MAFRRGLALLGMGPFCRVLLTPVRGRSRLAGADIAVRPRWIPPGHPTAPEVPIHRLVLWNIDLTLVDVGRVTRAAYADAFRKVTGRPLVRLPQMAGRTESEIFFEALALNEAAALASASTDQEVLGRVSAAL